MGFTYPALCHYEDGSYWSEFPDLKSCFSQGDTVKEILENSKEALECHLEYFLEEGKPLPEPTLITDLHAEGKDFLTYITCDISGTGKFVRKNVTLPEWLSHRAEKASINFSQTLQEALVKKLGLGA
jgi:predicted RNase H-like HicB family nuclease